MSFSPTSTVPVNFIDIAPILTLISALTCSGSLSSRTLPPSTQGTTRGRSVIVATPSAVDLSHENGWSSSTAMCNLLRLMT